MTGFTRRKILTGAAATAAGAVGSANLTTQTAAQTTAADDADRTLFVALSAALKSPDEMACATDCHAWSSGESGAPGISRSITGKRREAGAGARARDGPDAEVAGRILLRDRQQAGVGRKCVELARQFFGEGLTVIGARVLQITWKEHVGFVYDRELKSADSFKYAGEGWGLTHEELMERKGLYFYLCSQQLDQ